MRTLVIQNENSRLCSLASAAIQANFSQFLQQISIIMNELELALYLICHPRGSIRDTIEYHLEILNRFTRKRASAVVAGPLGSNNIQNGDAARQKRAKSGPKATSELQFARLTGVKWLLGPKEYGYQLRKQMSLIWKQKRRFFAAYHLALTQGRKGGKFLLTCEVFMEYLVNKAREEEANSKGVRGKEGVDDEIGQEFRDDSIARIDNQDLLRDGVIGLDMKLTHGNNENATVMNNEVTTNQTNEKYSSIDLNNSSPIQLQLPGRVLPEVNLKMSQVNFSEDELARWVDICALIAAQWMSPSDLKAYLFSLETVVEHLVPSCCIPIVCRIMGLCVAILLDRYGLYVDLRLICDTRAILKVGEILSTAQGGMAKYEAMVEYSTVIRSDHVLDSYLDRIPTYSFIVLVEYYILLLVHYAVENDTEVCLSVLVYIQALEEEHLSAALA